MGGGGGEGGGEGELAPMPPTARSGNTRAVARSVATFVTNDSSVSQKSPTRKKQRVGGGAHKKLAQEKETITCDPFHMTQLHATDIPVKTW